MTSGRRSDGSPSALLYTTAALSAFAANSVLCRLALGTGALDPYSFTVLRLVSGAVALTLISWAWSGPGSESTYSVPASALLVVYALPFSLAYVRIDTATGALLLFVSVQVTMILYGVVMGQRPGPLEWVGLAGALAGTVYLLLPGLTSPDPIGAGLMILAGVGWGGYSIWGKGVGDPLSATTANFRVAGLVVLPLLVRWSALEVSAQGVVLALLSGVIASGVGYAVWYTALRALSVTRAALVQLAVPVLAAIGGVLFIGESVTLRLVVAGVVTLGSIAVGIRGRSHRLRTPASPESARS